MARAGVNLLAYLAQRVFGPNWKAYYVAPMAMATLQVPFVYAIGKRLSGRFGGTLGALLLIYFPTTFRSASQLLPDGFVGTYALIAAYLFLRSLDAGDAARRRWLLASSCASFLAYLAKETALFFVPGFLLAVFLARRAWRDVLHYLAPLCVGIALESCFYALFTSYPHRYAIVTHNAYATDVFTVRSFFELFDRYSNPNFPDCLKFLLSFFLASSLGLLAFGRRRQTLLFLLIALSQLFNLTFALKSLRPLVLWQGFDSRYVESVVPFAIAATGAFIGVGCKSLWEQCQGRHWQRVLALLTRQQSRAVVALCLTLAMLSWAWVGPRQWAGFEQDATQAALVRDTYQRNLPILTHHKEREVAVVYSVLLPDDLLLRDGALPDFQATVLGHGDLIYLVRDPTLYDDAMVTRLERSPCVLEVSPNDRFLAMTPSRPLPPHCDNLLAVLQERARARASHQ
ncbi:MAG TPA: glycosyltransferase family 39 protein [Polyangiaceae bacterium]